MLGYMNREALRRTLTEGRVTFWSRSRRSSGARATPAATSRSCALPHSTAMRMPCSSPCTSTVPPATPARTPASMSIRSTRWWGSHDQHDVATTSTRRLRAGHRVCRSIRELFADGETPIGVYRKLADSRTGTFLLESAEQGGIWSQVLVRGLRELRHPHPAGRMTPPGSTSVSPAERALGPEFPSGPLDAVGHLYERWATPHVDGLPPLDRRPRRIHRLGGRSPARASARAVRIATSTSPARR